MIKFKNKFRQVFAAFIISIAVLVVGTMGELSGDKHDLLSPVSLLQVQKEYKADVLMFFSVTDTIGGVYSAVCSHAKLLAKHLPVNVHLVYFTKDLTNPGIVSSQKTDKGKISLYPLEYGGSNYLDLQTKISEISEKTNLSAVILYTLYNPIELPITRLATSKSIPLLMHHSLDIRHMGFLNPSEVRENKKETHVVVNQAMEKYFSDVNLPVEKILPPLNDIFFDTTLKKEISEIKDGLIDRYNIAKERFTILAPSRLDSLKGIYDLLVIAKRLVVQKEDFQMVFLNSNELEAKSFMAKAQEMGLAKNIVLIDALDQKSMLALYNLADVVVLPTKDEASGLVLQEAQSQAVPVVAYDVGGVSEVVSEGESGYLVPMDDIFLFAEKLKILINDSNLRKEMSNNALEFAKENFNPVKVVSNYVDSLEKVLGKKLTESNQPTQVSFGLVNKAA